MIECLNIVIAICLISHELRLWYLAITKKGVEKPPIFFSENYISTTNRL